HEPGARRVQVERATGEAEVVLDDRGGRRHLLVRRRRAEHEQVDGVGPEAGLLERGGAGGDSQRRRGTADAAFADAAALDDPLVAGVEGLLEVVVRDDLVRQRRAPSDDASGPHDVRNQAIGCRDITRSPRWARTPSRRPENGDRTSASPTVPSRSPALMVRPASSSGTGSKSPAAGLTTTRSVMNRCSPS